MIAATNSFLGQMRYDKWDKYQKRYVTGRYKVVPLDFGINSTGNKILYASDYQDHNQVKMFVVERIREFVSTKRRMRTYFPIKIDNLRRYFGELKEDNIMEQNKQKEEIN